MVAARRATAGAATGTVRRLSVVTSGANEARIGIPVVFALENRLAIPKVPCATGEKMQRARRLGRAAAAGQRPMIAAFSPTRWMCCSICCS